MVRWERREWESIEGVSLVLPIAEEEYPQILNPSSTGNPVEEEVEGEVSWGSRLKVDWPKGL